MDADLMDAILAMNAYDAGGTTGIITGSTIGNWSNIQQDSIPGQNYFAVVYQDGSNYTISYRGTTNLLGDDISGFFGSDVWNGYATGAGSPVSNDSKEAIQLYQSVLAQAGSISNITLTGHSMGGGLAGLVGDLYGAKAVVFDNMAFEAAANAAYAASIPGPDYDAALASLIYGSSTPTAPSEANLKGYYTAARLASRRPAHDILELDRARSRARRHTDIRFDLNAIAKGYGVDRLTEVARENGIDAGLFSIDGELRALGSQPDGRGWIVAIEVPDLEARAPHSILDLKDAAVATSGDYRHWVDVGGSRLSHTMDPRLGMPLKMPPSSVTVVAPDCISADAWATAMMVLGEAGLLLAEEVGLSVLFLHHDQAKHRGCGLFAR